MTILKILQYPDLRLRRKGYRVGNIKAAKIQKIIADMIETVINTENCGALAATQLDIDNPPKIVVFSNTIEHLYRNKVLCLINPEVTSADDYTVETEGCMSVSSKDKTPVYVEVKRANKIKARGIDNDGNKLEFPAKGYFARCIQHECDHLEGILNIDYLEKSARQLLDKKYNHK